MLKKLECSFTLVTNLKVSRLFPLDFRESDEDIQFGDILVHFHFIFLIEKNIFAKQFQIIEGRYQWWHNLTLTWNSIRSSLLTQLYHINQSETERCPLNQNNMQTDSPFRKRFLKMCSKFTREHPCRSVISIKLLRNYGGLLLPIQIKLSQPKKIQSSKSRHLVKH